MIKFLAILFYSLITLLDKTITETLDLPDDIYEENPAIVCPSCGSIHVIKNGSIHNGKPKYQCNCCGRQFVNKPTKTTISDETKQLIDRLLLERISLRGIARVIGVSWSWLQNYVNDKYGCISHYIEVSEKTTGKLTIECDEMWSFVDNKNNQVYIWLTIDRNTRQIVGCFIGDRTRKSARKLWESLPAIYQQNAIAYTDFWQAYKTVILPNHHRAVGKETGLTNHIERLNNTFRQRVSRLVRSTLSFSKKLSNHIGAIWYFVHGYNAELASL